MKHVLALLVLAFAACSPSPPLPPPTAPPAAAGSSPVEAPAPSAIFFGQLRDLCGLKFEGRVVSTDAADADMARQRLVMHVKDCSPDEVRVPFAVGDDTSRTWVVSRVAGGLRLKHDHRHADGTEDELSQYGGDTVSDGSAERQEFPADAFSKQLFETKGNPASVANVWALELTDTLFAYELRRPGRHFRAEFDLSRPVTR